MNTKRLVVKVGTSTLTYETGVLNLRRIDLLARTLSDLANSGMEVCLVTSAAIAVGLNKLKLAERPKALRLKQAAAAVGQCELMHVYDKLFLEYSRVTAQILLTADDVRTEHRKNNLVSTFDALFELGVIPIVNENDSVSHEEIETGCRKVLGDNDTLSAIVAELVGADMLVLLTDSDSMYDKDPHVHADAVRIPLVHEVDDALRAAAGGAGSDRGTGGMLTKLTAASIALNAGIEMVIAGGDRPEVLYDILDGADVGTRFRPRG